MPLLHRKLFTPTQPPEDLNLDDEVFHCALTNEIFKDYDEFYERTILCNSLVWSCSITDKPNLTYQEALDCENLARKKLSAFPISLSRPLVYLVGLSNRQRIDDLVEDLYLFVRERFFVGEEVEVLLFEKAKSRYPCQVVSILPPADSKTNGSSVGGAVINLDSDSSGDEDDVPLSAVAKQTPVFEASKIRYVVRSMGTSKKSQVEKIVNANCVKRRGGVFTRQVCNY